MPPARVGQEWRAVQYSIAIVEMHPQRLMTIRLPLCRASLADDIVATLSDIWPYLREHGAETGRNVVVYYNDEGEMEVGVEVASPVAGNGRIASSEMPTGRAAATTHFGEYADLPRALEAVAAWCTERGLAMTGITCEVYGHFEEDVSKRRTDVYVGLIGTPRSPFSDRKHF